MADIPSAGNKENKVAKNIGDTALCKKTVVCRDEKMETIIGQIVRGKIDRPKGSRHPRYSDMIYPINYGYVEGVISDDGQEQDVYVLGTDEPIETFEGRVIAIYHRFNDAEDKWIVSFSGSDYSNKEILQAIHFQEQYFEGELVR